MKKQKQPVDRDLVDRSFFARVEPFLYLLPFLIGIAVFTLYPVINVVLMSFKEGYSYLSRGFDQWGLANYQTVLSDPKFSQAIGNTLHVAGTLSIDRWGGNEKVECARRKFRHDGLLVFGRHFAVQQSRPKFGVCLSNGVFPGDGGGEIGFFTVFNEGADPVTLTALRDVARDGVEDFRSAGAAHEFRCHGLPPRRQFIQERHV